MATTSFQANGNKTVTIEGLIYTLQVDSIPAGVTLQIDGTTVTAGEPVSITQDSIMTVTVAEADIYTLTFPDSWSDLVTSFTFNGLEVTNGQSFNITQNSTIELTVDEPTITIDYTNTSDPVVTDTVAE